MSEHWAQSRDEVMDKWILSWGTGTAVGPELSWSHSGPGACGVALSPSHTGDISTVKVGGEGTDQLCHLTGNLTEHEGEKPASPWTLGLQYPTADSNRDTWTLKM